MSRFWIVIMVICWSHIIEAQKSEDQWMETYQFVYLTDHLEQAQYEIRYAGQNNFLGHVVDGYHQDMRLVGTAKMVEALKQVEQLLLAQGYGLKIFDTYRPQRAVDHFVRWSKISSDTLTKSHFYPTLDKDRLFALGYISSRSGHTRGSTVDLTLYLVTDGQEVDMGGPYDYFGDLSWHTYQELSKYQLKARAILKKAMLACGFRSYSKEWWHYTLNGEPYPKRYFNFTVPKTDHRSK